ETAKHVQTLAGRVVDARVEAVLLERPCPTGDEVVEQVRIVRRWKQPENATHLSGDCGDGNQERRRAVERTGIRNLCGTAESQPSGAIVGISGSGIEKIIRWISSSAIADLAGVIREVTEAGSGTGGIGRRVARGERG